MEKKITEERLSHAAEELQTLKQQQAEGLKVTDMCIERAAKYYSDLQVKADFFRTANTKRMLHCSLSYHSIGQNLNSAVAQTVQYSDYCL